MKRTLLALSLLVVAVSSQADNRRGFYAGAGVSYIDSGLNATDGGSVGFTTIELLGGYKLNPYVGAELRVGTGINGDENTIDETVIEYDVAHYESLYYRVESANQIAKFYGLLGYSNMEVDASTDTASENSSDSGFSWGAGIGFVTSPRGNLNFEYREILNSGDNQFYGWTMNYDFRF